MIKQLGMNPKDLQAAKKCDLSLFPDIAVYHGALVMTDGAGKYGPYNWRDKAVLARVHIAAAARHLKRWAAGEELTTDSKVHNLGAVIACCAILLDAQATGNLGDDRAKSPEVLRLMDELDAAAKALAEKYNAAKEATREAIKEKTAELSAAKAKSGPEPKCGMCGATEGEMCRSMELRCERYR